MFTELSPALPISPSATSSADAISPGLAGVSGGRYGLWPALKSRLQRSPRYRGGVRLLENKSRPYRRPGCP